MSKVLIQTGVICGGVIHLHVYMALDQEKHMIQNHKISIHDYHESSRGTEGSVYSELSKIHVI